jgi:hypothetical protein
MKLDEWHFKDMGRFTSLNRKPPEQKISAVWRSARLYASV